VTLLLPLRRSWGGCARIEEVVSQRLFSCGRDGDWRKVDVAIGGGGAANCIFLVEGLVREGEGEGEGVARLFALASR